MRILGSPAWFTSRMSEDAPDLPIKRVNSQRGVKSLILIGVDGRLVLEGMAEEAAKAEKKSDFRVAFKRAVAQ